MSPARYSAPMLTRLTHWRCVLISLWALSSLVPAHSANEHLETVVVQGTREEQVRRDIQTFVHKVTRLEGEFVGRWRALVCPMVVGVSDSQAQFMARRVIEVQNIVRKKKPDPDRECQPNLFVIITDEADQLLADWKERDPGMFRWKSREGVSRSVGTGPVRTWHNAIVGGAHGQGLTQTQHHLPIETQDGCGLIDSRIQASCWEHITAVVVLVDTRATGKVTLAQLADFISVVSLSQIDLSADLGGVDSILTLFAEPPGEVPPAGLTEWDFAFLNGVYRASYSPMNQQRDIAARMVRELAPR